MDFKMMGKLASLLGRKEQIAQAAERIKNRLEILRVEGSAGGGAVRAKVSGKLRVESISIDAAVGSGIAAGGKAKQDAEELIADAVNDAQQRAQAEAAEMIQKELKELGLDDMVPDLSRKLGSGGLGGLLS